MSNGSNITDVEGCYEIDYEDLDSLERADLLAEGEYFDEEGEYDLFLISKCGPDVWHYCFSRYARERKSLELCLPEAALNGDYDRVKQYLKIGVDVEFKDELGNTALHLAILNSHNEIARKVIANGACVNKIGNLGMGNQTPLHAAAINGNIEGMGMLLENGAFINAVDAKGETPLHLASKNGHMAAVIFLLEHGANINTKNVTERTCVFSAAYFDHLDVAELLIDNGVDFQSTDVLGNCILHVSGHPEHMLYFSSKGVSVNIQNNRGDTPLMTAVKQYRNDKMEALIKLGANLDLCDVLKRTPLHEASARDFDMVKQLVEAGAEVDVRDNEGVTPLHVATEAGTRTLSLLVNYGANVNSQNTRGQTPLSLVCGSNALEGIGSLTEILQAGGDPNITDFAGVSPLHEAIVMTPVGTIDVLLDAGADLCHRDNYGRNALMLATSPDVIDLLLKRNIPTDVRDKSGSSALHHFVLDGAIELMEILLKKDTSLINTTDRNGLTPLHLAALKGDSTIIECLLHNGANLAARDENGSTVLHYAACTNNRDGFKYFVSKGMNTNVSNLLHETPFDVGKRMGGKDIACNLVSDRSQCLVGSYECLQNCFSNKTLLQTKDGIPYITKDDIVTLENEYKNIDNEQPTTDVCQFATILQTSGIGAVDFSDGEEKNIKETIIHIFKRVSKEIELSDHRFKNHVVLTGSSAEDTKVGFPDEFDAMFVLETLSTLCAPPDQSHAENVIFIPVRSMDSQVPCEFREFFGNGILLRHQVFKRFSELVESVLTSSEFVWPHNIHPFYSWTGMVPKGFEQEVTCECSFLWRGSKYIHLQISVDMVPALYFKGCLDDCFSSLIRETIPEDFHLIAKPFERHNEEHRLVSCGPSSTQNNLWRISFTVNEQRIFHSMAKPRKDAYRICKLVRSQHFCPLIETDQYRISSLIPTYFLKIALFNTLELLDTDVKNAEIDTKQIALGVYNYLKNCFGAGLLPAHFQSTYNLLSDKEKLKQNPSFELEILACKTVIHILSMIMK